MNKEVPHCKHCKKKMHKTELAIHVCSERVYAERLGQKDCACPASPLKDKMCICTNDIWEKATAHRTNNIGKIVGKDMADVFLIEDVASAVEWLKQQLHIRICKSLLTCKLDGVDEIIDEAFSDVVKTQCRY